ncbi:MAG: tail fiber domain-containing protein, partial [Spirosomataceae bacterium]
AFVKQLKTATYSYKNDPKQRTRNGLIAQDVEETLKELGQNFSGLIIDDNEQKTRNLAYGDFVLPLINSVKELAQKVEALETQNQAQQKLILELLQKLEKGTK